jgi:hypothetical protein
VSHGYAMLPRYRGIPVCRCGACRRCKNREAVHAYRARRDEAAHAEEYERIDRIIEGFQRIPSALVSAGRVGVSVSGEVASGSACTNERG